jgi:hypothetical protein
MLILPYFSGVSEDIFPNTSKYILLLSVFTISYWTFVGVRVLGAVVVIALGAVPDVSSGITIQRTLSDAVIGLFQYAHYSIVLLFLFTGSTIEFFDENRQKFAFLFLIVCFAAVSFPNPLTMVERFSSANIQRVSLYTTPFIALGTGYSLSRMLDHSRRKLLIILCVLMLALSLLTISNVSLSSDRSPIGQEGPKSHFEGSEVQAIDYSLAYGNDTVFTDRQVSRYILATEEYARAHLAIYDPINRTLLFPNESTILLREEEFNRRGLDFYTSERYVGFPAVGTAGTNTWETLRIRPPMNKHYSSGSTTILTSTESYFGDQPNNS